MTDYRRWIKQVIKTATKAGWQVTINGHVKFRSPKGAVVIASSTPRNPQTSFSVVRDLRRAGLEGVDYA